MGGSGQWVLGPAPLVMSPSPLSLLWEAAEAAGSPPGHSGLLCSSSRDPWWQFLRWQPLRPLQPDRASDPLC